MSRAEKAIILTLLWPGIGRFYLGNFSSGLPFFVTMIFFWLVVVYKSSFLLTFDNYRCFVVWLAIVLVYILAITDTLRASGKEEAGKGHSFKFFLILGLMMAGLVWLFFLVHFDPQIITHYFFKDKEYRKDQAYLAQAMETALPAVPGESVRYEARGYRCPGCCLVGASAGLAHFYEPDIDFDLFVVYSIPTTYYAEKGPNINRLGPGPDVWRAFQNFGYTPYRGKPSAVHPPQLIFPTFNPKNFITFKNRDEEILFMKRLLSSGNIPIIPWGDFLMIVGYGPSEKDFWFSSQTQGSLLEYPPLLDNSKRLHADFVKAWDFQGAGFYLEKDVFFWVEKTGARKSVAEVLAANKAAAQIAPVKIGQAIEYLKRTGRFEDFTSVFEVTGMIALSRFLKQNSENELAQKYYEIAKIYDEAGPLMEQEISPFAKVAVATEKMEAVKRLMEEAARLWEKISNKI